MILGVVFGTYSSIYIANPILVLLKVSQRTIVKEDKQLGTGGAILNMWVVPIMLVVGFLTPLPYNYYMLKKHNTNCH